MSTRITKWPELGIARRAMFDDGSECEETSPISGVVHRRISPPIGYWQANAWAEGRAKLLGGTAEQTVLGPDGPMDESCHRSVSGYGPLPPGCVLSYHSACFPGWVVESRPFDASRMAMGEIESPYAAVLNAWERHGEILA